MMGLGFIWMLLFWGGLILLAIWLIAVLFPTSPQLPSGNASTPPVKARDILDQRYARGELSREQYDEMRQTMGGSHEIWTQADECRTDGLNKPADLSFQGSNLQYVRVDKT